MLGRRLSVATVSNVWKRGVAAAVPQIRIASVFAPFSTATTATTTVVAATAAAALVFGRPTFSMMVSSMFGHTSPVRKFSTTTATRLQQESRSKPAPKKEDPYRPMSLFSAKYKEFGGCSTCMDEHSFKDCPHGTQPEADSKFLNELRTVILDLNDAPNIVEPKFPPKWKEVPDFSSWEHLLEARGFPDFANEQLQRFISAPLTFPMTIANFLYDTELMSHTEEGLQAFRELNGRVLTNPAPIRICVVGARAEGALPVKFWGELNNGFSDANIKLSIVGPQVPISMDQKTLDLNNRMVISYHRDMYHDLHDKWVLDGTVPDLYVAFNSGVGFPSKTSTWEKSLELIFSTKKPFVLTSFDKEDQDRDFKFISEWKDPQGELTSRLLSKPCVNPMRSLRKDINLSNVRHMINTNWGYFAVQGCSV